MIFPVLETFFKQRSIAIEDTLLKQLVTYRHLLQEANRQFNLTAIITDQDIEIKHFIDSLWFPLPANAKTLLDVGSGAGFPGIPLHLFNPHLTTVLLEPNQKKATFLMSCLVAFMMFTFYRFHQDTNRVAHHFAKMLS
jgi:16S rRNA (guanine527-N7)-methyltransferase